MLIKIDMDKLQEIIEYYNLCLLVYYGSYARQKDYDPVRSDIDIAFLSKKQLDVQQLSDLMTDMILLHRKSDLHLVNLQTASGLLKEAVANDGRVLLKRKKDIFRTYAPIYIKVTMKPGSSGRSNELYSKKKLAEELKNVRPR